MALDEPTQDDKVLDRGAYRFVLDPQVSGIILESGGLEIDFVDEAHQKGYRVRLGGDGCGSGSCSC